MDSLVYRELKEEEREELQKVYQCIDKIWTFSGKANQELFIYLFGEKMGNHYWDKFTRECQRDILRLFRAMDRDKKSDLIANIFLNKSLYSHC